MSAVPTTSAKKITIHDLAKMKERREPITMLTAYDYPTALLADQAGIDVLLVGDSVGMVVHGMDSTLPVSMDMMLMHTRAVRRGTNRAVLIGDMPFMSYQVSIEEAKRNAGRFLTEGGADAVKLEGGVAVAETVRALVDMGIAVMGHVGLTPQSISAFGGFKTQGKSLEAAQKVLADAKAIQDAGAFSIVLEGIPAKLGSLISHQLAIPTIGIGAGAGADGQVLVLHDVLGLYDRFTPKFVKKYGNVAGAIRKAITNYADEVRSGAFPAPEHEFGMDDSTWHMLNTELGILDAQAAD